MKFILFILMIFQLSLLSAQEILRFSIQKEVVLPDQPVNLPLDGIDYNNDKGELTLYEVSGDKFIPVPSQIEAGHSARLWFILKNNNDTDGPAEFVVMRSKNPIDYATTIEIKKNQGKLRFEKDGHPVLNYRYGTTYPPDGIDPLFRRSGFIHPLWSPAGEELTRIQPSDHYHHYGIWGPWTKTHIEGREVDFWNLGKGEGTVKFAGFLSLTEGPIFSSFRALQQHIDFGVTGADSLAISEVLDVRIWNIEDAVWVIDYTTSLNSELKNGILLDAYRYGGGIGFRATEKWHKDNCTVLTSENKTRANADGSNARWCIVEGESETPEGRSGIVFMSHPANRMHPEPMRVWPLDANAGRGDIFFEFTPIRHKEWKIEPHHDYTLKYRMIVFDGTIDAETAEKYWQDFAKSPKITIIEKR